MFDDEQEAVQNGQGSDALLQANADILVKSVIDKIVLKNSLTHKDAFETNNLDSFTVECLNVGTLNKITIGHDNKGGFAGWYVGDISVSNANDGQVVNFRADRWLDKKEGDGKLQVELTPINAQGDAI